MIDVNWRGARALIASTWAEWLQHRGFFFLLAFGWMVPLLVYLFVWSTAAGNGTVGTLSRGEWVGYYLVLIVVNQLTLPQTNWTLGDVIRIGSMDTLLLRPMPPLISVVASQISGLVVYSVFVIPVVGFLGLILRPELHVAWQSGLAFVPALILAGVLRFLWGYWLALLAFWATRADALLLLQDTLVFLLAGQVAPTILLPGPMRQAASVLPFRYMLGFPIEVLIGKLSAAELQAGFLWQSCWLGVAIELTCVVWRKGVKRYSAVGG
jgi:ABC-2 type transport system permease protein